MKPAIEEIQRIVAAQLGVRSVSAGQRLVEDLGAESIDLMNIVATAEKRFQVVIEEESLPGIRTVSDLHRAVVRRRAAG